jgi:transcriptional regulator NrdR family protein
MYDSLFRCLKCNHKTIVSDSRPTLIGGFETIVRTRRCRPCGTKQVTAEVFLPIAEEVLIED